MEEYKTLVTEKDENEYGVELVLSAILGKVDLSGMSAQAQKE